MVRRLPGGRTTRGVWKSSHMTSHLRPARTCLLDVAAHALRDRLRLPLAPSNREVLPAACVVHYQYFNERQQETESFYSHVCLFCVRACVRQRACMRARGGALPGRMRVDCSFQRRFVRPFANNFIVVSNCRCQVFCCFMFTWYFFLSRRAVILWRLCDTVKRIQDKIDSQGINTSLWGTDLVNERSLGKKPKNKAYLHHPRKYSPHIINISGTSIYVCVWEREIRKV